MVHPILVVDDDATQLGGITRFLKDQFGYQVEGVSSGREAVEYFLLKRTPSPELIIINHNMVDMSGIEVVRMIRRSQRRIPIVLLAAPHHGSVTAEAIAAGVDDVLMKPVQGELLKQSVWTLLQRNMLAREVGRLNRYQQARVSFDDVASRAESMRAPIARAKQAANSGVAVLISGASGVGKAFLARVIHGSGEQAGKPISVVNCELLDDSEASAKQIAHEFHAAKGSTLLLTHVHAATASVQQMILAQVNLQRDHAITGHSCHQVRLISTASSTLKQRYESGAFDEKLYFHLTAFPIALPTLESRKEDLPQLCDRFLSRLSLEYRDRMVRVSPAAERMMLDYDWPENIRELQMVLTKALVYGVTDVIEPVDLALVLAQRHHAGAAVIPEQWMDLAREHPQRTTPFSLTNHDGNIRTMHELEAEVIRHAIRYYKGHMSEVARRLGIGRSTLYRKIQDHNLEEVA